MYGHERSLVKKMQGRPFVLLGVNNDDSIETVRRAIEENNLNWRSFYDGQGGPIVERFGIRGFPTIMLIDHRGEIIHSNVGLRGKKLDREIERLVKAAETDGHRGPRVVPTQRKFTDKSGEFSVEATALSLEDGSVVLQKADGTEIRVKVERLSRQDRDYLETVVFPPSNEDFADDPPAAGDESAESAETVRDGFRTFRDTSGKFSARARWIESGKDGVVLEKEDGTRITVPLEKLSEADQEFLRGDHE